MRLESIKLDGFRGFTSPQNIPLSADVVIIAGGNGRGKTSLYDAILWSLVGSIDRLGPDAPIVSLLSETGIARVALTLVDDAGAMHEIVRTHDGTKQRLHVEGADYAADGDSAELKLSELLLRGANEPGEASLSERITRTVYLQQDLLRTFVEDENPRNRFQAFSKLLGTGELTSLQRELEAARTAWSKATNIHLAEETEARNRLAQLEQHVESLSTTPGSSELAQEWYTWWREASAQVGDSVPYVADPASPSAAGAIDNALRRLSGIERDLRRTRDLLVELSTAEAALPVFEASRLEQVAKDVDQARASSETLRNALTLAETRAAERRRLVVEVREREAEVQSLASLALRHLGEVCPVCEQPIDTSKTRSRLEGILQSTVATDHRQDDDEVSVLSDQVSQAEQELNSLIRRKEQMERDAAERTRYVEHRQEQLQALGLGGTDSELSLQTSADKLISRLELLAQLQTHGRALALNLAGEAERAQLEELADELQRQRVQVSSMEAESVSRRHAGRVANEILEALRTANVDLVRDELERLSPLLQRLYSAIDPNPVFRRTRLASSLYRGHGQVSALIEDSVNQITSHQPQQVLSSSQLNALAVSLFLTLNLGSRRLPFDAALLDDPLQSLDDINLLGLVDLLRRVKARRQIVISTHSRRFGELLERKFRPVRTGQSTLFLEFQSWSRNGPTIRERRVHPDAKPLRLVG